MFRTFSKGFLAGVVATLVFQQALIWLLTQFMPFPFKAWNMAINSYGVPSVLALAFWGGVWGIALCGVVAQMLRVPALLTGAVLGAIVPSVWYGTVIAVMKSQPLFAGGELNVILIALLVNAVWGLATVALFHAMGGGSNKARARRNRLAT